MKNWIHFRKCSSNHWKSKWNLNICTLKFHLQHYANVFFRGVIGSFFLLLSKIYFARCHSSKANAKAEQQTSLLAVVFRKLMPFIPCCTFILLFQHQTKTSGIKWMLAIWSHANFELATSNVCERFLNSIGNTLLLVLGHLCRKLHFDI